jgi:hypothetical protein
MSDLPRRIPLWRRLRPEVALSLAATALSLCAVATTIWQTGIMRAQLRASVWPRLQLTLKYFGENNSQFFRLHLDNVGVGPAVITQVQILHRGKQYGSLIGVFHSVREERHVPSSVIHGTENNDPIPDMVIPQQQGILMLVARGPGPEAAEVMKAVVPDLQIRIRYASIYGEEWEVAFPERRLRRVGWREVQ